MFIPKAKTHKNIYVVEALFRSKIPFCVLNISTFSEEPFQNIHRLNRRNNVKLK